MTLHIPALETQYASTRFRSRIEARWAVFFTRLGLDWEYEPEGFVVGSAFGRPRPYLPDFLLPELGIYIEVKPALADQVDPDGTRLWEDFAGEVNTEWTNSRAVMLCGPIPDPERVDELGPPRAEQWFDAGAYTTGVWHLAWCACPSGRHFDIQVQARGGRIFCGCPRIPDDHYRTGNDPSLLNAYGAARSARFEHGERPAA